MIIKVPNILDWLTPRKTSCFASLAMTVIGYRRDKQVARSEATKQSRDRGGKND